MSIYSTPISQLKTSDLAELLQEQAVENIRLEFKREVPDKDETLKKLSSFANTFGGLVIVGASAQSKDGRIEDLPGVDEVPGYKQKIVDWCFQGCSPPITVDVSGPIPTPNGNTKVCYVISVEESEVAPHFLNGRNGVWIRTNEFSGRFHAALVNESELEQLLHRRELILDRRRSIVERARKRFSTYRQSISAESDSPFELCIVPRFPARPVCNEEEIPKLLGKIRNLPYRNTAFPQLNKGITTQHESAIIRQPLHDVSLLEANVWGMIFYGVSLEERSYPLAAYGTTLMGIHLYEFVGRALIFLQHANELLKTTGLVGPILIQASMRSISQKQWIYAQPPIPGMTPLGKIKPPTSLDDDFTLSVATTVEYLREHSNEVATDILRSIFFSVDWAGIVDTEMNLRKLVQQGYEFNNA